MITEKQLLADILGGEIDNLELYVEKHKHFLKKDTPVYPPNATSGPSAL